jgi:DNA-binding XRE family transcriptional regulator
MVDERQAELALVGETVLPRALWDAYKRDNPGWRDAWWRRVIRESFKELRGSRQGPDDTSFVWTVAISAPWNTETDTHAETAVMDQPIKRDDATEIAQGISFIEVVNSAKDEIEYLSRFDWELKPGRLYSAYVSGAMDRDGKPENGRQQFSCIMGVTFISELVKDLPDQPPVTEALRLSVAGGDPRRLEGDASKLTPEELDQFWIDLYAFLEQPGGIHPIEREPHSAEPSPVPSKATDKQKRSHKLSLLDAVNVSDKNADAILGLLDGKGLPRSGSVPSLGELIEEEIRRYQEQGETAGDTGPLRKNHYRRDGYGVELSPAAKKALKDRVGLTGFREIRKDLDHVQREYLTKYIQRKSGYIEARYTWYGLAWPFSPATCETVRQKAEESLAALGTDSLFWDEMNERQKEQAESTLGWLQCLGDARRIADVLVRRFGHEGVNPISIPDRELRFALSENDPHGHARVKGALFALSNFHYQLKVTGPDPLEKPFGNLIYEPTFTPGGAGAHRDGVWTVTMGETAIGALKIFEKAQPETADMLRDSKRRLFDFSAPVKDAKLNYQRRDSMITPYFMRIAKLTSPQERLLRWMEWNLTRNQDAAGKGRKGLRVKAHAPNATEPRIYTKAFCPRLHDGEYVAALGHFSGGRSPECGFRLKHLTGIMEVEDREDAVQAILAVTQKAFPGCAAVHYMKLWMGAEEALGHPGAAADGNWFLFLPKGWVELMHESISRSSDYEVTRDAMRYRSANSAPYDPGTVASVNDPAFPLWSRMAKGRFDRKMSQGELAKIIGVSQPLIALWESKKKPIPSGQIPKIEAWLNTIYPSPNG